MKSDIIALCGVDGSGKSSLLRALQHQFSPLDVTFVSSAASPNATLVEQMAAGYRSFGDFRDWMDGSFARLVAMASCLDFLRHYDDDIRPLIGSTPLIVCDRYSPCYMAYARLAGLQPEVGLILNTVQAPAVILYLDARLDLLPERYAKRGGPKKLESPLFAQRFSLSYQQVFATLSIDVIRIDNSGSFELAVETAISHLQHVLAKR